MDKWIAGEADFLDALAQCDPVFLELRQQHDRLMPAFDRLMEDLPEEQRELVLEYLNLQLDMEARKTRLAWLHK